MEFGESLRATKDRERWKAIGATLHKTVVPRRPSRLRGGDEMRDELHVLKKMAYSSFGKNVLEDFDKRASVTGVFYVIC